MSQPPTDDHASTAALVARAAVCLLSGMLGLVVGAPSIAQDVGDDGAKADATDDAFLPPELLNQVTPVYPPGATKKAEVTILVTVGVDGTVLGVAPLAGPAAFTNAASEAARLLRFAPATQGGVAVQADVPIVFRFAPPSPEGDEAAFEVVVEGTRRSDADTHSHTTLDEQALERTRGQDFAEAVSSVPGVSSARGSADTTKPIIRGQYERRLLILNDGVRHESQKWGSDHATEIDPFAAGRIRVVKGAAGVRYGPDAIGGVVLVEPPPLRFEPGVNGAAQLVGVSNGRRPVGALRVDAAPGGVPGLAFRVEGNYGRGAAISAPDYVLGNTASEQWNLGATARYLRGVTTWTLAWHHYDLAAGVCYCLSHPSIADLESALDAPAPIGAESWQTTYTIDRPYQAVRHDTGMARSHIALGEGSLQTTYAFQLNDREEFEQVRGSVEGPQYDFLLRTHSLDVEVDHGERPWGSDRSLDGGLGLAGSFQENVYAGLPLIPNHRSWTAGVFGHERLTSGRYAIELGARYDHQSRTSFLTDSAFAGHVSRDTLEEDDCDATDAAVRCAVDFDTGSVSAGVLGHVVPDRLDLKLDLSSANRFPNGDELYMNGSAPTSPVYALGDPSLGVESTWGASATAGLRLRWLEVEGSAYGSLIDDYITFAPEIGDDGEPAFDVTIRGAYPRFTFQPVDAWYYGLDGGLCLGPDAPVGLEIQGAVVRGRERATGDWLLFVPPDRAGASLIARPLLPGRLTDSFVEVSTEYVAEQTRGVEGADLAPPPGDYVLLGAGLGTSFSLRGERSVEVSLEGQNLSNARYRDYTSLLRYYADEPGRELRLRLAFDF